MAIDSHPPDIVISDLAMPVDDGLSFVARLRICEEGRKVRAIALTAVSTPFGSWRKHGESSARGSCVLRRS